MSTVSHAQGSSKRRARDIPKPAKPLPKTSDEQLFAQLEPGDVLIKVVRPENSKESQKVFKVQRHVKRFHDFVGGIAKGIANVANPVIRPVNELIRSAKPISGLDLSLGSGSEVNLDFDEMPELSAPDRGGYDPMCMHAAMYVGDECVVEEGAGENFALGKKKLMETDNRAFHVYRYCNRLISQQAVFCIQLFMKNKWTSTTYGLYQDPRLNRTGGFFGPVFQRRELGPQGSEARRKRAQWARELATGAPKRWAIETKDNTQLICSEVVIVAYQAAADLNPRFGEDPIPLDASATSPMALQQYLQSVPTKWEYQFSALRQGNDWAMGMVL